MGGEGEEGLWVGVEGRQRKVYMWERPLHAQLKGGCTVDYLITPVALSNVQSKAWSCCSSSAEPCEVDRAAIPIVKIGKLRDKVGFLPI